MTTKPNTPKADAGAAAAAYYEKNPSSKVGEFSHADAQVADLNQTGSTETRQSGGGVPTK